MKHRRSLMSYIAFYNHERIQLNSKLSPIEKRRLFVVILRYPIIWRFYFCLFLLEQFICRWFFNGTLCGTNAFAPEKDRWSDVKNRE